MKRRTLIVILSIVGGIALLAGIYELFIYDPSEIIVSATFRIPNDNSPGAAAYSYVTRRALPAAAAEVSSGAHDAPFKAARFHGAALKQGLPYGPTAIRGKIARQDILAAMPRTPYYGDWPFSVSLFNTSDGRKFHIYMDIFYDDETRRATATLYVYYPNSAHPEIRQWEGELGESISLVCEL